MVLGHTVEPFYIQPTGYVNTFAASFYPYGFANFIAEPVKNLVNKETPISNLFDKVSADKLELNIVKSAITEERIGLIEKFLLEQLVKQKTIDTIVKTTVDTLLLTKGSKKISKILESDPAEKKQLERRFRDLIGLSPKQLGKVIRLQSALKLLLNKENESLTDIAYNSNYYDQSHFIKDFDLSPIFRTRLRNHSSIINRGLISQRRVSPFTNIENLNIVK